MNLIDSPLNGATERPGTSNNSLFVFLAGPIRIWWSPEHEETPLKWRYMKARDEIHEALSNEFLVYAPHRAWRGPWNEVAQRVNDLALLESHALVRLTATDESGKELPAVGTEDEEALARAKGIPVFYIDIALGIAYKKQLKWVIEALNEFNGSRIK